MMYVEHPGHLLDSDFNTQDLALWGHSSAAVEGSSDAGFANSGVCCQVEGILSGPKAADEALQNEMPG